MISKQNKILKEVNNLGKNKIYKTLKNRYNKYKFFK